MKAYLAIILFYIYINVNSSSINIQIWRRKKKEKKIHDPYFHVTCVQNCFFIIARFIVLNMAKYTCKSIGPEY